jgi:hypothetical protein
MLEKLNSNGYLGFISSVAWQTGENFCKLREYLFNNAGIVTLINLPFDVFKNAYVDTGVYVLSHRPTNNYSIYCFPKKELCRDLTDIKYVNVSRTLVTAPDYKVVLEPRVHSILAHLSEGGFVPLGKFTISTQGLAANRFQKKDSKENGASYPFVAKGQIYRYSLLIDSKIFVDLEKHPSLKPFYESKPKLLVRRVINRQDRLMATYIDKTLVFKKDVNPFVIVDSTWNALFVLGILNSKLISYIYVNSSSIATKDDFRQTTLAELRRLPIRRIDFKKPEQVKKHDRMVLFVEQMLDLHKKLNAAKVPDEKTRLQRQIDSTDAQIDKLVYDLYALTPEEIAIVGNTTP